MLGLGATVPRSVTENSTAAGAAAAARALPGARAALLVLLGINLFNYVDRYLIAAVEPAVQDTFFKPGDPNAEAWMGSLGTAFTVSYLALAPVFGWLADRTSRWILIG